VSRYKVMVDDNFEYMRPEERYELGVFPTLEKAIAACKHVVDDDLKEWTQRNITAMELYELWAHFGADPFIVPVSCNDGQARFSAWDYAKERSESLAASSND